MATREIHCSQAKKPNLSPMQLLSMRTNQFRTMCIVQRLLYEVLTNCPLLTVFIINTFDKILFIKPCMSMIAQIVW